MLSNYPLFERKEFNPAQDGVYSNSGIWNNITWHNNKPFKERAEVLILKDNQVFLEKKHNGYRIPGGAIEKHLGHDGKKTVFKESQEEARITIKNIFNPSIKYIIESEPAQWEIDEGLPFKGKITHVFVAEYGEPFRGKINKNDQDLKMLRNGRFYPIDDLKNKHHINAMKKYKAQYVK